MGTWGPGNLENDYALDELSTRTSTLVGELLSRARSPSSREADDYDYTTLFVELEIAIALDARGLLSASELPKTREVQALARDFIASWDANIDALSPKPEFKRKRRAVILATFDRFAKICARHGGGAFKQAAPKPRAKQPPARRR